MELAILALLGLSFLFALDAWLRAWLERHDARVAQEWLEEQRKQDKEP